IAMGEFDSDDYNLNRDLYQFSIFNSAFLAEPDRGLTDRVYNKIHLVPFAEGIPYVQRLKPLVNLISAVVGMLPFGRGTDYTIYDVKGRTSGDGPLRFGVLICYESCYPRLSRRFVRTGAEMLVVITNDAWYETTAGPAQHQMQSVFRAVETRRWIVRCANHGISCFISPLGRIELESGLATEAALRRSVQGVKELTFYARRGDLFGWLALAITIGFIAASAAARQKAKVKRQKSEI
ncbi:apolipoprotein N-acyltransferase, partial [Candidatus Sumerlaeota bacterium]|nr:apolipoprotein N-acyltransferase [Candidatus Sumerlaeota bacterium]